MSVVCFWRGAGDEEANVVCVFIVVAEDVGDLVMIDDQVSTRLLI